MTDSVDDSTADTQTIERARLGDRLRDARNYRGLTQEEVAAHLNIPRTALTDIESGRRRVDALELARLAKLYGQPVTHFTEEGDPATSLPPDVTILARQVASLSMQDREELGRFAEYLRARSKPKDE